MAGQPAQHLLGTQVASTAPRLKSPCDAVPSPPSSTLQNNAAHFSIPTRNHQCLHGLCVGGGRARWRQDSEQWSKNWSQLRNHPATTFKFKSIHSILSEPSILHHYAIKLLCYLRCFAPCCHRLHLILFSCTWPLVPYYQRNSVSACCARHTPQLWLQSSSHWQQH